MSDDKITDRPGAAAPRIPAICKALLEGLVAGHDAYLKMAGHGARAMPESFLQAHAATRLADLYQSPYHVWLEPTFQQLGMRARGRQRIDIAVVNGRSPEVFRPRLVVEVKRGVRSDVIGNDLDRLAAIIEEAREQRRMIAGVMLCYHIANTPNTLYHRLQSVLNERQDIRTRFFCLEPKETRRKNGALAYYQALCFRV